MPHFPRMSGRELVGCLVLDGWTEHHYNVRGGETPTRALLEKDGFESRSIALAHVHTERRVRAICESVRITAEKLGELMRKYAELIPANARRT